MINVLNEVVLGMYTEMTSVSRALSIGQNRAFFKLLFMCLDLPSSSCGRDCFCVANVVSLCLATAAAQAGKGNGKLCGI